MLEFKIKINNGAEIAINEPIGFDGVDFNLTRSEELYGVSSSFAGNSIDFEFVKEKHDNVFDLIINEYETKGFNANVLINIYYDSTLLFDGNFDFSTAQTDGVNYLKVQVIKKDKLYYLDKNKSNNIDLLSEEDLYKNTSEKVAIKSMSLPPIKVYKESIWENPSNYAYIAGFTLASGDEFVFNNIKNQTKDGISDSLNWLENWTGFSQNGVNNMKLISVKDNLTNVNIDIDISGAFIGNPTVGNYTVKLVLRYGSEDGDWYNNATTTILLDEFIDQSIEFNNVSFDGIINIPELPRGSAVWLCWQILTYSAGGVVYRNNPSSVKVSGYATSYYSSLNSVMYKDLVSNTIKKTSGISNVFWNVNFYDNTFAFNGNLLRLINDKPFYTKWADIVKQFGERNLGCYYNETSDTLYIDHRSNILGNNKIIELGDLAKKDVYSISEDSKFIVNKFSFKYSKYQALKDVSVDGNAGSVHGESEWVISNKGFEGTINVDLPYIRDSFMIEDIRLKANNYKEDTSTNEDDTIILIEAIENAPKFKVTEIMNLQGTYDSQSTIQTFRNDGSFSFIRIGFDTASIIEINGDEFYLIEFDDSSIQLTYVGAVQPTIYNGVYNIEVKYRLMSDYIAKLDNEQLNQDFSLRQNINYWKETLSTTSFYHGTPIINTLYKENKNAIIKGLSEIADINIINAINKPRLIETTIIISVREYNYLKNNRVGYVRIKDAKDNDLDIYITELSATFLNGCDQMKAVIKGWAKPVFSGNYIITKNNINGFYYNNLVFQFNDVSESVNVYDGAVLIYYNLKAPYICSDSMCFLTYNQAKNYLLSL